MARIYPKNRKMPDTWKLGERNSRARLTWLQAAEIRSAPKGYGTTKALSVRFGISRRQVRAIRSGTAWIFE